MRLEGVDCLLDERDAVREEEDALRPIGAHEQSVSAITVRVLPAPVAITSSALRWWSFSNASATRRIARVW